MILTINALGKEKTQYYHNPSADSENLLYFVQNIYDRLLGGNHDIIAWPYDMSIMTLFSYPAQYSVTASFIRGYDGLFLYHMEKLRLLVSDTDLFAEHSVPHNGTILYVEDQELELNPSGSTVDLNFITFSISGYRTVDFHFYVFLESGVYLHFAPSWEAPELGFTYLDVFSFNSTVPFTIEIEDNTMNTESTLISLPAPWIAIIFTIPLLIASRRKKWCLSFEQT